MSTRADIFKNGNHGPKIREARDAAHLTQVELAELLGVSQRVVQDWEAGKRPGAKNRRRLIRFVETGR